MEAIEEKARAKSAIGHLGNTGSWSQRRIASEIPEEVCSLLTCFTMDIYCYCNWWIPY